MGDFVFILWVAIALGGWSIVWEVAKDFKATTRRLDRLEEAALGRFEAFVILPPSGAEEGGLPCPA